MRKIINTYWFTNGGIVKVLTDDGIRYYIKGISSYGTPEDDAQDIADWGSRLDSDVGEAIFGRE